MHPRGRAGRLAAAATLATCLAVSPPARAGDAVVTLIGIADQALARGDFAAARDRYARVLAARPDHAPALVGLGRVALLSGELETARGFFERALAADPGAVQARVGLADVAVSEGDPSRAREVLEPALADAEAPLGVHARMAQLTGRAPPAKPSSPEEALRLAEAHPYDPVALVAAGDLLAGAGRGAEALPLLEKAVWLSDIEPLAARRALALLPGLSAEWSRRRVVPVHVYADESFRAQPVWRFQLRSLWAAASAALDPLLETRFVIVSIQEFETADLGDPLDPIFQRLIEASADARGGIVAGFTARPEPHVRGLARRGMATFLGRRLVARVPPPAARSRVLVHELLHLYGAVHVPDEVASLMNPTGGALELDAANARVVRALRSRHFASGVFARDVLGRIDLEEAIAAYEQLLKVNLYLRRSGISEAYEKSRHSRFAARRAVLQATQIDANLADMSRVMAQMLLAVERRVDALVLLEMAAQLYGDTPEGRSTTARARELRRALEDLYLGGGKGRDPDPRTDAGTPGGARSGPGPGS
jgi:tetratricopeptide (TPR) repeat protein